MPQYVVSLSNRSSQQSLRKNTDPKTGPLNWTWDTDGRPVSQTQTYPTATVKLYSFRCSLGRRFEVFFTTLCVASVAASVIPSTADSTASPRRPADAERAAFCVRWDRLCLAFRKWSLLIFASLPITKCSEPPFILWPYEGLIHELQSGNHLLKPSSANECHWIVNYRTIPAL